MVFLLNEVFVFLSFVDSVLLLYRMDIIFDFGFYLILVLNCLKLLCNGVIFCLVFLNNFLLIIVWIF